MPKAELKANPDPHWVRDTLVEDYLGTAKANGASPSAADVERLALSDLAVYEAVKRDDKPRPVAKRGAPADPLGVGEAAKAAAAETGWQVVKRPLPERPRRRFGGFLNRAPKNPKQAAAIMRLGQVLSPKSMFRPSLEWDYTLPRLAQRFTETMQELDRGLGEFEGKSEEDCERIVWRRIEDICDKSTGLLGGWWVPK